MTVQTPSVNIFLLAGVKTSPSAFAACERKLDDQLRQAGHVPRIHVVFPYGDASRSVVRQVLEVQSDLSNRTKAGRIGGREAWRYIKETVKDGERTLLIGHSGGGAAAYQAARLLEEEGLRCDLRVVQIGSPRIPIAPHLQEKVSYFHSIDETGKLNDPISRIGTWGGWCRQRSAVPRWNRYKYAPGL